MLTFTGIERSAKREMSMKSRLFLMLFFIPVLRAELPPSAYESMQAKASEYFKVEILRVDVEPGETPTQQKVHLVALITEVIRTASGAKPNEIINILYTVTEHPKGWVGPGAVPIPNEKERTVAYLSRTGAGDFEPAAGRMSFTNF
jgi:phenylpyruvate tautomerase PptA (4-oxalocrotonate tautomerase family)